VQNKVQKIVRRIKKKKIKTKIEGENIKDNVNFNNRVDFGRNPQMNNLANSGDNANKVNQNQS